MNLNKLFDKPKIIGMCANQHTGKTNTLYHILDNLSKNYHFKVYTYGLRLSFKGTTAFKSVEELEQFKNSIIIIDEMFSLFDLDNRKVKAQIEKTIRLLFHNNNILLLCGLGENFKKFLSAKIHAVIFKQITFSDLINGSRIKQVAMNYCGDEAGSTMLDIPLNKAIVFNPVNFDKDKNQSNYTVIDVPYMEDFDSKLENKPILTPKSFKKKENVSILVPKNVPKKLLSKKGKKNVLKKVI